MVAAWLKIATLVLKASPASKKQRPHRQNEFSEHQNASNADALTGAGEFCKKLSRVEFSSGDGAEQNIAVGVESRSVFWRGTELRYYFAVCGTILSSCATCDFIKSALGPGGV